MKTVSFYSYKGGVGRTLALSNIAKRLVELGKSVCMLDFDLEAPGLYYKFKKNINTSDSKIGIVDYIYEFSENNNLIQKITSDYYYDLSKLSSGKKSEGKSFTLIPAGNIDKQDYWEKLSRINWIQLFYEQNSKGIPFFLDLKEKIKRDLNPDYLLIDTRTGITEISGMTMSILSDQIVFLSANNEENITGCQRVIKSILNPENNLLGIDKDIVLVLTRIPYSEEPQEKEKEIKARKYFYNQFTFIKEQFNKDIQDPIVIHSDRDLEYSEELKIGYDFDDIKINKSLIGQDYLKLFNRITKDDFSEEERDLFNNIKKAEMLYVESFREIDTNKAIELLKEAVKLNRNESKYYFKLGDLYYDEKRYVDALEAVNEAIEINDSPWYHNFKGCTYAKLGEGHKALQEFEEYKFIGANVYQNYILAKKEVHRLSDSDWLKECNLFIDFFPQEPEAYNARANAYRLLGEFELALKDAYKAIEFDPENPVYYATLSEIRFTAGNMDEFYVNFERALKLELSSDAIFEKEVEDVYIKLFKEERFRDLLEKYGYAGSLNKIDKI